MRSFTSLANMGMRVAALLCRLGLTFYITHQLGLEAMAVYGFIVGAAAIMTAVSGLGISWRMTRLMTTAQTAPAVSLMRDRLVQRLLVQILIVGCGAILAAVLREISITSIVAAAVVITLEPVVSDLHQIFVYRHKPVIGNLILLLRSASWIPIIIAAGVISPEWCTFEIVLIGWVFGLLATCSVALLICLISGPARSGLMQQIDWPWILSSALSSPIVFISELGATGLLYSDRYIVAMLLGDRASGTFTFIWSILNAVVPIVQGGVFNQIAPQLASQWSRQRWRDWLRLLSKMMYDVTWMSSALGIGAVLAVLALLPTANLPLSTGNITFAGLMTFATVLRMRADVLHHALYSAEQDSDWIAVNILGLVLGPLIALFVISLLGFVGAGVQMVIVAYALYAMRSRLMRRTIRQAETAGQDQDPLSLAPASRV